MTRAANLTPSSSLIIRLATGLAQGVILYGLSHAEDAKIWPATQPLIFAPLAMATLFAPFVILAGLGALKRTGLIVWSLAAALLAAGLAYYGAWRGAGGDGMPDAPVFLAVAAGLFIAHHLIQPAEAEGKWIAPYRDYFDVTWMHGVQLVLAAGFTGAFWILLFLGSALFKLIGIEAFQTLITKSAFAIPATTVMFAAAVHLTDGRSSLVRGVRTVALTLLAWLLPLMTLIAAAFLASLPFTGLEPLWKTRAATALLLTAAAHLIVLINAAYQDGEEPPQVVLAWAARLAGLLLIPISALAAYGLSLRIGQHGLTPERVFAAAFVLIAAGYAVGYTVAAVRRGAWMKTLEITNILQAFVALALILALFTPIADPARLSVNDQVARLERGKVKPETFDFQFLRFHGGPYGKAALERLKTSPQPGVAAKAREAAQQAAETSAAAKGPDFEQMKIYPAGATLPASFRAQDWSHAEPSSTCVFSGMACSALILDTDGDGVAEVLLTSGGMFDVMKWVDGRWRKVAEATQGCQSVGLEAALKTGPVGMSEPVQRRDLLVGDQRLALTPVGPGC